MLIQIIKFDNPKILIQCTNSIKNKHVTVSNHYEFSRDRFGEDPFSYIILGLFFQRVSGTIDRRSSHFFGGSLREEDSEKKKREGGVGRESFIKFTKIFSEDEIAEERKAYQMRRLPVSTKSKRIFQLAQRIAKSCNKEQAVV